MRLFACSPDEAEPVSKLDQSQVWAQARCSELVALGYLSIVTLHPITGATELVAINATAMSKLSREFDDDLA